MPEPYIPSRWMSKERLDIICARQNESVPYIPITGSAWKDDVKTNDWIQKADLDRGQLIMEVDMLRAESARLGEINRSMITQALVAEQPVDAVLNLMASALSGDENWRTIQAVADGRNLELQCVCDYKIFCWFCYKEHGDGRDGQCGA